MMLQKLCMQYSGGGGGGGVSLPLEAVPDAREKKRRKGLSKSLVGAESADHEKGIKIMENGENGIQIAMIRV